MERHADMTREEPAMMSRRRILGMGVGGGAVAAGALLASGVTGSIAEAAGRLNFTTEVVTDLASWKGITFDFDGLPQHGESPATQSGAFWVEGAIYPDGSLDTTGDPGDAEAIGFLRAWGFLLGADVGAEPLTGVATVESVFFGRGSLHAQGGQGPGPNDGDIGGRAVIGGTGEFAGVRGETVIQRLGRGGNFRVAYALRA